MDYRMGDSKVDFSIATRYGIGMSLTIEQELAAIKDRNARVEFDKAWEVSWTRRVFITIATYIVASVWLVLIHDTMPLLKALVPSAGYLLSTLSLPFIKEWWGKPKP